MNKSINQSMQKIHKNYRILYRINYKIYIHWISRPAKISKNLQIDEQAKKRLKLIENHNNDLKSFQCLNKRFDHDKYEKDC